MFKSVFVKYISAFMLINILSIFLSTSIITTLVTIYDENNKKRMLEYCNYHSPDWEKGFDSVLRSMYASSAGLLILPVQDLLGYGSDTRLNIPGKADGNWQFRITEDQLNSIDKNKFRHFNELYKRV